ncbi:fimbrial protein [Moraxella sp. ZY200743]|uniref:fimbrial protein n=1 Tax=Moraxella sp. ZY200743 TaxID=2911970 RepID=UPI003D7E74F0
MWACRARIQSCPAGVGNDIVVIEEGNGLPSELCIFDRNTRGQRIVISAQGTVSYPRDTLTLNHSLGRQTSQINLWISGTPRNDTQYRGGTAPWTLGADVAVTLPIITTIGGQTIYELEPTKTVGLRLWMGVGAAGQPNTMVNDGYKTAGNRRKGNYWNEIRRRSTNHPFRIQSEIILLKPDAVGQTIVVNEQVAGMFKLHTEMGKISGKIDYPINIRRMEFTFLPRTCDYSGLKDQTVKLDKIGVGHFANGRNEVYGGTTTVNLNCDRGANVEPWVVLTDNNNVSNTTSVLTPAAGSTAQNVGIQVYLNDSKTPVKFGPVVYNAGTQGTLGQAITKQTGYMQKLGNKADTQNGARSYPLTFTAKYFRTNTQDIVPGKVNGEMIFNFAYY